MEVREGKRKRSARAERDSVAKTMMEQFASLQSVEEHIRADTKHLVWLKWSCYPIAAFTVVCSVWAPRKALISYLCFGLY